MKRIVTFLIRTYQRRLRHLHNRACIYAPSCSEYAILAVQKHGSFRGLRYGYLRIRRCSGAMYQGGEDWP